MTTLCLLLMTGLLSAQQPAADPRAEAERLARTGSYAEALRQFEAIAAANPDDLEARVWIGRLQLRMGHADRAAGVFRSILTINAERTDALVGLGEALTDLEQAAEAVDVLNRAEKIAPDDAAVLAAQGAAHIAAGHIRLGLAYYHRAVVLRPADPAIRDAYEDARLRHGHAIAAAGYFESYGAPTPDAWSGIFDVNVRLEDQVRLFVRGQQQRKFDETDQRAGAGVEWRVSRRWTVGGRALYGGSTSVLPRTDNSVDATFAKKRFSVTSTVQYVSFRPDEPIFTSAQSWIFLPSLTVRLPHNIAIVGRYAHLITEFESNGDWISGNAGLVGVRLHPARRFWFGAAWAGGIEDFDTLSVDRLGVFHASTLRADVRLDLPSLTSLAATYDYQWREHNQHMARVTVGIVQRF